eukprot:3415567-Rhodomonas_salina.1
MPAVVACTSCAPTPAKHSHSHSCTITDQPQLVHAPILQSPRSDFPAKHSPHRGDCGSLQSPDRQDLSTREEGQSAGSCTYGGATLTFQACMSRSAHMPPSDRHISSLGRRQDPSGCPPFRLLSSLGRLD